MAHGLAGSGGRVRRGLPAAFVASTLFHAAIGLGLALWIVPGQQSSLPAGDAPLAVTIRPVDPAPVAVAPPGTPAPGSESEAPTTVTVATASASVPRQDRVAAPTTAVQATRATSVPGAPAGTTSAPPIPAVATGTTTLAIDATIPANVALGALAALPIPTTFPVEVGKLVRLRSAPAVAYPPGALARAHEGSVLALVIVDEHGMPYDISLLEFDKEFVEAAETALKETRFTPAEDMNGNPIMFHTMVRIRFLGTTPGKPGEAR